MSKANKNKKQNNNKILIVAVLILAFLFTGYKYLLSPKTQEQTVNPGEGIVVGADLKIAKSDITETAKFYPYQAAGTYMEVVAVKATDGTIRTALNTCQVCYDSGAGYYKQQGNTLVCQNCGNVFGVDDVEIVKGGCNPVPILQENKTEDGETITISGTFLANNKTYFEKWKR